ncbi:MAG: AbrB/MazE/SpoVT family DNA-binding domain-containing protein [Acidobacteria bacterium]|jgi:antitoxin MazE|nr:AbrB/MazE/SpoVT family DNA-binding domain-containing protein [Acidobacteriota bacterium]
MATTTRIVRIGNSRGIRIPKALLDQAQLPEEVELHAERGRLVVKASRGPRFGWTDAARVMHARGEDRLLDEPTSPVPSSL